MEVHRKILIHVGVVPIVPCATRRQAQKIERKQLILSYFQLRSVEGEIVGLILKWQSEKQGWLAWLWWEFSEFLLSSLQGKLGLLQGEEALDRILKPAQRAAPKWALVQSTCGWMLLEAVSGNCCCIYSTVKKKRFKKVSIKGVVGWEIKFPGAKSNGAFMFSNFGVRSWKSLLAGSRGSRQSSNKVPITCP